MDQTKSQQPYPLRGCYFCGINVQVKHNDIFLLRVHENGRSFNFCVFHKQYLKQYAPWDLIDYYRRRYLKEEKRTLSIKQVPLQQMVQDIISMTHTYTLDAQFYETLRQLQQTL
jgi:hypothetical protein